MKVEIIERKPTTIVGLNVSNVQLDVGFALTAVVIGIVAFVLILIRAFSAWGSGQGRLD